MSYIKKDQVFLGQLNQNSDYQLATAIAQILRHRFLDVGSAVKVIGRETKIHPRAIRNWYEGRNTPSSLHLIMLAQHIPEIAELILRLANRQSIWGCYKMITKHASTDDFPLTHTTIEHIYTDKFVSINVTIPFEIADQLNQRQLWFLGKLQQNLRLKPDDIAKVWAVTIRTAWRDTSILIAMNLIVFTGSRKTGWYEIRSDS